MLDGAQLNGTRLYHGRADSALVMGLVEGQRRGRQQEGWQHRCEGYEGRMVIGLAGLVVG